MLAWALIATLVGAPNEVECDEATGVGCEAEVVVVQGEKQERKSVQAETRLHGEELQAARGETLGEMLQYVPGVSAIRTGSIYVPIIHGMFANRVALFNDGVRHASQNWGLDHAPEVDPFAAESIRIVKGAAGVRYGPEAIGGAILLEPNAYLDVPGIEGSSYVRGESNGWGGVGALVLRGNHAELPQLAWKARISAKRAADLRAPENIIDNTDVQELNGGAGLRWTQDTWSAEIDFERFTSTIGTFTGAQSATASLDEFESALERDVPRDTDIYNVEYDIQRPRQELIHTTLKGRAALQLDANQELRATLAYQSDDRDEFALVRDTIQGPQQTFALETTSAELMYHAERMTLNDSTALTLNVGATGMAQDNLTGGTDRETIPSYDAWEAGVFGYAEIDWRDFVFEFGGRFDRREITAQLGTGFSNSETTEETFNFNAPSITLGAAWRPTTRFELHADLSSATRPPSAIEQFTDGRIPGLPGLVLGDPESTTETAWNLSVGAAYGWSWGRFQATAFGSQVDDFIYFAPLVENGEPLVSLTIRGALPVFAYRQIDARLFGGEASLTVDVLPGVEWMASASYIDGRNVSDDEFLLFMPPPRFQNTLTWRLPWSGVFFDSFISAQSVVVLEQTNFEPSTDFAPPPDGYHLLSFAAGTSTEFGEQELDLGVAVNNATNARYRNYTSLQRYYTDEPGISVLFKAALHFSL